MKWWGILQLLPSLFNEILGLRCLKTQFVHVESGLEISSIGDQLLTAGRQWATHVFFSFNLKGKRSCLVQFVRKNLTTQTG